MVARVLMSMVLVTGLVSITPSATAGQPPTADWSQWRGPSRSGAVTNSPSLMRSLPESGLKPLWQNTEDLSGAAGWSSPVVANGRVYQYGHARERREDVTLPAPRFPKLDEAARNAMSDDEFAEYERNRRAESIERQRKSYRVLDRIICLNADTGESVWTSDLEGGPTRWRHSSTPAATDDTLYYLSANRKLRALDLETGEKKWETPLPIDAGDGSPISSSPLVVGDVVVVLAERLIGISTSGELLWTGDAEQSGAVHSSPVAWTFEGRPYVIANLQGMGTVCVDAATGKTRWQLDSDAGRSTPVVTGDRLLTYGRSRRGGLRCYRLTAAEPELEWKYQRVADQGSSPVVVDNRVFVQGDRVLACLDLESGDDLWTTRLDRNRPRYTSPVASGGVVLYTFGGVLGMPVDSKRFESLFDARIDSEGLLASEETFRNRLRIDELEKTAEGQQEAQQLWQREVTAHGPRDCVSPAIANGRLYLRLNKSLACYDLTAAE